ncbi:MAG: hypothetical protein ABJP48_12490 [Erythrobacter sp.]
MIRDFIKWSAKTYRLAVMFFISAFVIVLFPILTEALQHFVEYRLGMFDSSDGIVGDQEQNLRLAAGIVKVLSLLAITIIVPRFFLHENNLKKAMTFSPEAKRALLLGALVFVGIFLFIFYLGPALVEMIVITGVEISENLQRFLPLVIALLISFWFQIRYVGATATMFDDDPMSEAEKKRFNVLSTMHFLFVAVVTVLPLMVIHYQLNFMAVDLAPVAGLAVILVVDSIVVGMLSCLLGALVFTLYQASRERS